MKRIVFSILAVALFFPPLSAEAAENPPLKVFILAGDHNVLEQAPINGTTLGASKDFPKDFKPQPLILTKAERKAHSTR